MRNKMDSYVLLGLFTVISIVLALPFAPMRQAPTIFLKKYVDRSAETLGLSWASEHYGTSGLAIYDASGLPNTIYSAIAGKVVRQSYSGGTYLPSTYVTNVAVHHQIAEQGGALVASAAGGQSSVAVSAQAGSAVSASGVSAPGLRRVVIASAGTDSLKTTDTDQSTKDKNGTTTTIVRQRGNQLGSLPLGDEWMLALLLLPLFFCKLYRSRLNCR